MSARDSRITWAKLLILLGMGIYLTQLIISGNLTNYINQRFAWLAYVGAGIFFALALASLLQRIMPSLHGHQHYRIGWDILLIAAFPLALALLIPSRSLGIEAINGGVSLRPVGVGNAATFARSPLDRNILDWLREFSRATPAEFNDLPVDVIGFVYREPVHAADEFLVSRFTMSCCVADAFPIGMPARADFIDEVAVGSWVRVQGRLTAANFAGEPLPVITVESLEPVDEPEQPYLYP
ncbi:MAG: TIGR03943 family protein [Chloroflexi bacterium]|nr:TIGR03943 family protein [Chloroflexota bacterium]MCY4247346.1 TIGR03943 family protein [Chloroflexota bacterium]